MAESAASAAIEVTDDTFQQAVIDESFKRPVVVDFWAPWCGPCQTLGPIIEGVAATSPVVRLVKVNIDENPKIAGVLKVESIPAVKAFRDGKVVREFLGAVPEPAVREFFAALAPSEADELAEAGAQALLAHDYAEARAKFEAALEIDEDHERAIGGLAAVCMQEGDLDAAEELVQRRPNSPLVRKQALRLRLERGARLMGPQEAAAALDEDDGNVAAHYAMACHLALRGQLEAPLEHAMNVVMLDRAFQDDAGRKLALEMFQAVGEDHPVAREYRQRLTNLLF